MKTQSINAGTYQQLEWIHSSPKYRAMRVGTAPEGCTYASLSHRTLPPDDSTQSRAARACDRAVGHTVTITASGLLRQKDSAAAASPVDAAIIFAPCGSLGFVRVAAELLPIHGIEAGERNALAGQLSRLRTIKHRPRFVRPEELMEH